MSPLTFHVSIPRRVHVRFPLVNGVTFQLYAWSLNPPKGPRPISTTLPSGVEVYVTFDVSIPRRVHVRFPRGKHKLSRRSIGMNVSIPRRVHVRFPRVSRASGRSGSLHVSIPRRVHVRFPHPRPTRQNRGISGKSQSPEGSTSDFHYTLPLMSGSMLECLNPPKGPRPISTLMMSTCHR